MRFVPVVAVALLICVVAEAKTPFVTSMNRVCAAERAKTHAIGAKITSIPALAANGPALAAALTNALTQLKHLGAPPARISKPVVSYISLQAQEIKVVGEAVAAAKKNDQVAAKNLFAGTYKSLGARQDADLKLIAGTTCYAASEPK